MERLMDMPANRIGLDPKEIRLRNLIQASEFPYKVASGIVWDRAAFHAGLNAACAAVDYDALRARQSQVRAAGRWFGIGIACYAELTGIGSRLSGAAGYAHQYRDRNLRHADRLDWRRNRMFRHCVPWTGA